MGKPAPITSHLCNFRYIDIRDARLMALLALNVIASTSSADPQIDLRNNTAIEESGAIIGEIIIESNNVFDTTSGKENRSIFRLANRLHVITRPSVIRSQLQVISGDRYSEQKVHESERLLRQNRYLYDADIRSTAVHDGVVDLKVSTRDNWTLLPTLSISRSGGEDHHRFGIEEQNLLGSGTNIKVEKETEGDRRSTIFEFSDRNLGRSWVGLDLSYRDGEDGDAQRFRLTRPFYALTTRWAAGVDLHSNDRLDSLYSLGDVSARYHHDEQTASAWFGWSSGLVNKWAKRWSVGYTSADSDFSAVTEPNLLTTAPDDRSLHYSYLRYEAVEDRYDVTRNLNNIGLTEDINLGTHYSATIGYLSRSLGADRNGMMFRTALQKNYGNPSSRLLLVSLQADGRYESSHFSDARLRWRAEHYERQSERHVFYASLRAEVGHRLSLDNPISLGGKTGLRGYPRSYGNGDASALLTLEQRLYTEWHPFRLFRVGGAAFMDVGRTWGEDVTGKRDDRVLASVGVGLRLALTRGDSNKVVHIDLAMPLRRDSSIDSLQVNVEAKRGF